MADAAARLEEIRAEAEAAVAGAGRTDELEDGMRTTLERLRASVEAS